MQLFPCHHFLRLSAEREMMKFALSLTVSLLIEKCPVTALRGADSVPLFDCLAGYLYGKFG